MKAKMLAPSILIAGLISTSLVTVGPAQAAGTPVPIMVDGPSATISLGVGEEGAATFTGTQGQRITVQTLATNVTTYPSATRDLDVDVVNMRTGRTVAYVGGDYEDVFEGIGEAFTVPENGEYQLRVSPDQRFAGDVRLTLLSPYRIEIAPGESPVPFDLAVGEEAIAKLSGTKDQIITVQTLARSVTRFPSNTRDLNVSVVNASTGRVVQYVGGDYEDVFEGVGEAVKLPVTGPYEIRIQPEQYFAGQVELKVLSPQTSQITVGGGTQTVSLGVGEEAVMQFSGSKDQLVTVRTSASNVTRYPNTYSDLDVYVTNAKTGRTVANVGDDYSDVFDGVGETVQLPVTGQYTIRIAPDQYFAGDVSIELLAPETSAITINGAPVTFALGIGSEAVATFTAKQGQRITVQTSISGDSRYPSNYRELDVYLINARTGRTVANVGDDYEDVLEGVSETVTLRESSQYRLRVSPDQYFVGSVTLSVTSTN